MWIMPFITDSFILTDPYPLIRKKHFPIRKENLSQGKPYMQQTWHLEVTMMPSRSEIIDFKSEKHVRVPSINWWHFKKDHLWEHDIVFYTADTRLYFWIDDVKVCVRIFTGLYF